MSRGPGCKFGKKWRHPTEESIMQAKKQNLKNFMFPGHLKIRKGHFLLWVKVFLFPKKSAAKIFSSAF